MPIHEYIRGNRHGFHADFVNQVQCSDGFAIRVHSELTGEIGKTSASVGHVFEWLNSDCEDLAALAFQFSADGSETSEFVNA